MKSKTIAVLATAAALPIVITACGGNSQASQPTKTVTATVTSSPSKTLTQEQADKIKAKAATDAPGKVLPAHDEWGDTTGGPYPFGTTVKYSNGMTFTVGQPAPGRKLDKEDYAVDMAKKANQHTLVFPTTVKNTGQKLVDLSGMTATGTSAGTEIDWVTLNDSDGPPDAKLLPGQTAKFKLDFAVKDASNVTLDLSPLMDGADVIYTSEAGQ